MADGEGAAAAFAVDEVGLGVGALLGGQVLDLLAFLAGELEGVGEVGELVGAEAQEQLGGGVDEQGVGFGAVEV